MVFLMILAILISFVQPERSSFCGLKRQSPLVPFMVGMLVFVRLHQSTICSPAKYGHLRQAPARLSLEKQRWWRAAVVCVHRISASWMTNKKIRDHENTICLQIHGGKLRCLMARKQRRAYLPKWIGGILIEEKINGDASQAGRREKWTFSNWL